jgi:hypothetical protein
MLRAFLAKLGWFARPDAAVVLEQPTPNECMPSVSGTSKDAWEGWYDWHAEADLPVKIQAEIRYVDGEGQETTRRITTRHFGPENDDYCILAYCHLRQQNRTFKSSRIRQFVDVSTGEVVGDIPSYLRHAYDDSPTGRTAHLLTEVADDLVVLLYVARADARLSPKEKTILVAFLRRIAPSLEFDMALVDAALSCEPSQPALKRALKTVLDTGRTEAIMSELEALAAARRKMDDFTDAAIKLVRKRLGGASVSAPAQPNDHCAPTVRRKSNRQSQKI